MNWNYIIHIGIISFSLLFAAFLRARIKFFQKYLIPSPILAGILLLVFYNFIAPMLNLGSDYLGELVYHLLNISFISMMLRVTGKRENKKNSRRILAQNVTAVIGQYGLQTFFGLLVTALLISTVMPDLFPAIGFTLALGWELGPGQAFSIGSTWQSMGFEAGPSVGLTMAAIGFLVGSFGGVVLINTGIKKGWVGKEYHKNFETNKQKTGFFSRFQEERPIGSYLSTDGESLDTLTYHIALVMITYLISYALLTLLSKLLILIGPLGVSLADSLWGINFVFSAFSALGVKM
ncbi:MAG: sodium:glutamate symporter, partial [Spirochaetia bacterium]|nr:sodium:glutamate symporter [Spirochaetia bacterium]